LGSDLAVTEPRQPLVGRDRELDMLGHLLDETRAGSARFVFVTGEPGIGKTSLLVELLSQADDCGCLALRGGAAEFERELPFGLVVDAFDEYLASLDPHAFSHLAAEDLGELAGVFPAVRSLDPGSGHPTTAAERFRVHHALRDLIERLAARQPLVLMLDDLHWADGASLELASYLLRHPPRAAVMIAATFRTGQADPVLVTSIDRASAEGELVDRIALGPLTADDAGALFAGSSAAERERLYEASGGNPFYLLQLARMGGDRRDGDGDGAPDGVDVPATVRAAIAGELDALSRAARRFAEAAAVTGDPFELDLAVAASGVEDREALEALDELIARDLVRPAEVPRRFSFRHPMVRRAVYETCPWGVRLAAHARSADALAARGAPAAARAHHVEHAARHGDRAAVAVLREAGETAGRRAPTSAARWFELALRLLPESAPPAERVELLTALAEAQAATGRFEESRAALVQSIDLTVGDGDEALHVELIGACAGIEQLLGHYEAAHARLAATLAGLPDARSTTAVQLMIHLATGDFYRMDYEEMREWGARAHEAARALGERPLTAASAAVLAVAEAFMGAIPEAELHSSEAAALADHLPDEELGRRLDSLANLATAELYLHRYDDAAGHARRGLTIGRAIGRGELSPILVPVLSNVLHVSGRIAEAGELLDGAVEAARLSGNVQALGWNLLSRAFTAVAAGDLTAALAAARESVEITRDLDDTLVSIHAGLALATALFETGETERAIEVFMTAAGGEELPRVTGGWRTNYFELLTRCWLARGRPVEAARAADRAAATAARVGLRFADAMAHRAAAAVALQAGREATAARRALAAAAIAETLGARVEAARSRTLAGRALGQAGEARCAVAELERAVEDLDACGAVRYRQEAEHELRRLGRPVHHRTRPGRLDGTGLETLTEREAEVARLVVDRRTNPEIATELFLSVKTIETHMRNIFRKLHVSSRVEVARTIERAERAP
jgi:ATP/maltotriose-dependent transcriptional regulator MalT